MKSRSDGLDILRALAIVMVMTFHVIQMSPITHGDVQYLAQYGRFGVDLFFVLSGWLIGRLFWREWAANQTVNLRRFWIRRWLRTIPPYLVALHLSWLAVFLHRGEVYDIGYLIFIQNYYQTIPYFLVSWSLCVEEHFYFFGAVIGSVVARARLVLRLGWVVLAVLFLVSIVGRFMSSASRSGAADFGYDVTATHLSLDGLAEGVALAFVSVNAPRHFERLLRLRLILLVASCIVFLGLQFAPIDKKYLWNPFVIALLFGALLLNSLKVSISQHNLKLSVFSIAISSYSAYLVHPLCIHLSKYLNDSLFGSGAI